MQSVPTMRMRFQMPDRRCAFPSLLVAATAALLVWISSPWGVGTSPDSIQYMLGAAALNRGGSILELSRHWPPLYPLVLSLVDLVFDDIHTSARVLHASLFALNTMLFSLLVSNGWRDKGVLSIVATAVFALAPASYSVHYMAWSEPLFFTWLLLHMLALRQYLAVNGKGWLYVAGLCLGLSVLTRYAGVAFVGGTGLFLLLHGGPAPRARFEAVARITGAAALLPLGWMLFVATSGGEGAPRQLEVHLIDSGHVIAVIEVFLQWFQSGTVGIVAGTFLLCVALACAVFAAVRNADVQRLSLSRLLLGNALVYIAFIFVSISLFDYYTPIDIRILSPVYVCLLAAVALCGADGQAGLRWGKSIACGVLLCMLLGGLQDLSRMLANNTRFGAGYFSAAMQGSPIVGYLRDASLPPVYSNAAEFMQIYFGMDAKPLPSIYNPSTNLANQAYSGQMDELMARFERGEAAIVYFDAFAWRAYQPGRDVFEGNLSLPTIYNGADGAVYHIAK